LSWRCFTTSVAVCCLCNLDVTPIQWFTFINNHATLPSSYLLHYFPLRFLSLFFFRYVSLSRSPFLVYSLICLFLFVLFFSFFSTLTYSRLRPVSPRGDNFPELPHGARSNDVAASAAKKSSPVSPSRLGRPLRHSNGLRRAAFSATSYSRASSAGANRNPTSTSGDASGECLTMMIQRMPTPQAFTYLGMIKEGRGHLPRSVRLWRAGPQIGEALVWANSACHHKQDAA